MGLKPTAAIKEIEEVQLRASSLREWAEKRSTHPRPAQGLGGVKVKPQGRPLEPTPELLAGQGAKYGQSRALNVHRL